MFGRATMFVAILSAFVIAFALLAQATHFSRETLMIALLLISVALFIGITTFVRCVVVNYEDARWVAGMNRLRSGYLKLAPGLEPFFITSHEADDSRSLLAHGSPQRFANLRRSLTTTSSVVAALNSVLAGSMASDIAALCNATSAIDAITGAVVSLLSAVLHVRYAARFRQRHDPTSR